jgi:histidinol-phosphate aminotransferase
VVHQALADQGIVVRDIRRYPGLSDALRLTIGRPEDNQRVYRTILAATATAGRRAS